MPLAATVKVAFAPAHTAAATGCVVITGAVFTTTTCAVVAEQPAAFVTVTVYVSERLNVFAALVVLLPPDHV